MEEVLKRVGRYDLLEVIGRGGAAIVYLAYQRDLDRRVALKELAPHPAESDFAGRFVEESRLAASMSHPNVVTVHEYFEADGIPYIAMEYLPHGSLRQYVGRLSMAQIAGVLEGVLAGLSHGAMHGVVHRDLKPENLLVAGDGRVKIADFGVARAYNSATRAVVTVAGTTIGTPAYMSPEQALGGELTAATDLYSLGVVTWELLTGHVPFEENDTPVAVLYRHVHEPVPPVRSLAPEVDQRIADWLDRLLAKQPEDRFGDADTAWLELEDVVLDLLGPRWRRSARLAVGDATAGQQRTLTPARFAPDERGAAVEEPVVETIDEPPAPAMPETSAEAPGGAPPITVAPQRVRQRSRTTMFRIPRRHSVGEPEGGPPPDSDALRRRAIAAAILLAMVGAAVAGVVLANTGGRSHAGAANRSAASATNRELRSIVHALAVRRALAHTRLSNPHNTRGQQALAARAVQSAYATAGGQLTPFVGRSAEARLMHQTVTLTAAAYGRLAAAARTGNSSAWTRASAAIALYERQLQAQIGRL